MRSGKRLTLTTPDLVLLSLLAERPMHGYEANLELERRCIRDWAAISRPQVYYSLEKLAAAGFIRAADSGEPWAKLVLERLDEADGRESASLQKAAAEQ